MGIGWTSADRIISELCLVAVADESEQWKKKEKNRYDSSHVLIRQPNWTVHGAWCISRLNVTDKVLYSRTTRVHLQQQSYQ